MLAAGAFGTLAGGRLSDLHSFRRVIVFSLFASAPLALLVPLLPLLALFPVIALFGLITEMNFYPIVVVAQQALPRHVGFASGVTLGASIGLGSLASPLLGVLADHTSLRIALLGAASLALLAALASLALPRAPA
jgi:FSR family fosmidomycin resistance protein-like MFS transporter